MADEKEIVEKLKQVIDPHTGVDVHAMGLINEISIDGENIRVTFTPTSPFCPMGIYLAKSIQESLSTLEGIRPVVVIRGHIREKEINAALEEAGREC